MRYLFLSILLWTAVAVAELFVYESFDYQQPVLGNSNGGLGFGSIWASTLNGTAPTGFSAMTVSSSDMPNDLDSLFSRGGCIHVAAGNAFSAVRTLDGLFEKSIDLSADDDYYISFLFRRDDNYNTNTDEWFALELYSFAGGAATDFLTIGTNSNESIYIEGIGGLSQTSANIFELNKTYLFVVKIAAENRVEPAQSDRVFLKIYEQSESVDMFEREIEWLLVSEPDEWNTKRADCLQISGGSGTGYYFDELRIGTKWTDVVDFVQSSSMSAEQFDYQVNSSESYDGGVGFNGSWCGNDAVTATDPLDGFVITNLYSLSACGAKYKPVGGCMTKEDGVKGWAFRYLEPCNALDLNTNKNYYLSFLFRRDDVFDSNGDEWYVLRFYCVEGQGKDEMFSIVFNSNESVSINGIGATDSDPDIFNLNDTYLVIIKIAAQDSSVQSNYDQVFLKIVGAGDILERTETSDWTLAGGIENNSHKLVNLLQIAADDDTGLTIDELRIAESWEAVASAEVGDTGSFFLEADISKDYAVDEIDLNFLIEDWLL